MRDPARIDEILALLGKSWREHPDQRLGQLMTNAALGSPGSLFYMTNAAWGSSGSLFYIEDEQLAEGLRRLLRDDDPPEH